MTQLLQRIALSAALLILAFIGTVPAARSQAAAELAPQLEWPTFPEALTEAETTGKVVLIDIWSRTCGWCRKLQTEVYTQPDLQEFVLSNFVLGRLDIDIQTDTLNYRGYTMSSQMLSSGFGATGTPTTIFLEPDGTYITRLQGFHAYDDFFDVIRFIGTGSFREMSFPDFLKGEGESEGK